ncbi:TIM-barrel domain-containing protein [Ohtaekwangia sp.]|uniref:TIM-barrel domain-containing protein n=1 Tax=Ohtaekwangia sp. TaxID=2066019 RepID=UPI002FDC9F2D
MKDLFYRMKKVVLANIISLALLLGACSTKKTFEKLEDGVVVHLNDGLGAKQVRLQVISDDIIHVTATPADTFSHAQSLVVLPEVKGTSSWKLEESADALTLLTKSVHARISLKTGEVSFTDSTGQVILQEKQGGGKSFTPVTVENLKSYAISQVFESPADEAFYGLGGHQNGQMNYKGQDVELVQQNIVDVIPFLYSSKNYGLLWDNYSISKFGDPREYQPLSSLKLFTKDGKEGGLTADYYVEDKIKESKVENKIDFQYLETPQVDSFPKDVSHKGKIVWEGSFTSDAAGLHKFLIYSSGYIKIWIDGTEVLNKWRQNWNPWTNKFNVDIKSAGEKHAIKIEWTPDDSGYLAVTHLDPYAAEDQNRLSLSSEVGDEINYYFIKGKNADDVINGYRNITGKAPIAPKWAMGFWQSRERYTNQKDLIDVVKEYRKRHIPLDNIVLDWQYWEDPKWGSHEFDLKRFPNPKGMVDELHNKLHAQLMISVWPKFNKGTENYEEMRKNGFLYMHNIEKKRKDWVGIGYESTFYDPFNPEAGKLFWKQIDKNLNSIGIDAWWLDATEPDIHSNISIDERKINMSTAMGPGAKYFNAYSLMNAKGVYEGQRASSPEKRVFILTRSAFAGQQRYGATTWSGDIVSRWSDLQDQIATGINFSLSGIPYWTMDIGGFAVEKRFYNLTGETLNEWRELNTRWFQFGVFCPVFRSHGQFPLREIYNIAPEGTAEYNSLVYYDKLRYHLLPYIYSLAGHSYFNNSTIMRGLVMDFNADSKVHNIADEYMFGPDLLINPVHTFKARTRQVYLPATTGWYDLYTGKYFDGGQTIEASAPLDRIPVYVKEGSILPAGPEIQYTSEKSADPLTLYVYAGKDASFTLYEDEGINYNYEQGKYSTIPFTYNESTKTLTIGDRQGSYQGMPEKRTVKIVWVNKDHAAGVSFTAQPAQVIEYTGKTVSVVSK